MKEKKRFTLGILISTETRKITSQDFIKELETKISNYNSNKKNPYFIGDVKVNEEKGIITFKKYKKIIDMRTLKELDKLTTQYKNEDELLRDLRIDIDTYNQVVIMYRGNKTIRFIHVLYNDDKKYLDKKSVRQSFIENGKNIDFLNFLFSKKHFMKTAENIKEIEYLYYIKRNLIYGDRTEISLTPLILFFDAFTERNNRFNYFNFRMLATLLREYNLNNNDTYEQDNLVPTKQEEKVLDEDELKEREISRLFHEIKKQDYSYKEGLQTILYGYKLQILKDIYRELKEDTIDIESDLETELQKRLKLAHETTK